MRRWQWFEPAPKQPVPADGLKVGRFGTTWWGKEWIAALERLGSTYSSRLPRGRSYARSGRVVGLEVGAGVVTAGVVGTRPRPYRVEIRLGVFAEPEWQRVVDVLSGDARLVVQLLRRELPPAVGEKLRERGVELFPRGPGDLTTTCSCPDWANPCKHVAAVHYVVAAALDADPFLAFRLRGLGRDDLLAALARGCPEEPVKPASGSEQGRADEGWEEPGPLDEAAFLGENLPLAGVAVEPRAAEVDLFGLKRMGAPPRGLERLPALLAPVVRRAGQEALRLAFSDGAPVGEVLPARDSGGGGPEPRRRKTGTRGVSQSEGPPSPAAPLDRRVVNLLRAAGSALSLAAISTPVGASLSETRKAIASLRRTGTVVKVGSTRGSRYALGPQARVRAAGRRGRR